MTLHEHDRDLVMALAEGSLDAGAEARAHEELAGCAECADELVWQIEALDVLEAAPPIAMTGPESSELHLALDAALIHQRVTPAPIPAKPRGFNWVPIFSVAAVLLALVLVAPALDLLGSSDDASFETAAQELTAEDEAGKVDTAAPPEAPAADEFDRASVPNGEQGESGGAVGPTDTTTAFLGRPTETTAAAGPDDGGDDDSNGGPVTTSPAASEEAALYEEELSEVEQLVDEGTPPAEARSDVERDWPLAFEPSEDDDATCVPEGVERAAELYGVSPVTSYLLGYIELIEGDQLRGATVHAITDETVVVAHDATTCAVLASSPLG